MSIMVVLSGTAPLLKGSGQQLQHSMCRPLLFLVAGFLFSCHSGADAKPSTASHRQLTTTAPDLAALDISVTGACQADLLFHCSHLLTAKQKAAIGGTAVHAHTGAAGTPHSKAGTSSKKHAGTAKHTGSAEAIPHKATDAGTTAQLTTGSAASSNVEKAEINADSSAAVIDATTTEANAVASTSAQAVLNMQAVSNDAAAADGLDDAEAATASVNAQRRSLLRRVTETLSNGGEVQHGHHQHRQQLIQRRRRLQGMRDMLAVSKLKKGGGAFHRHELDLLAGQQEEVGQLLSRLDLNPNMPIAALTSANAPLARCLRQVVHEGQVSISPDAPVVSDECTADIRAFFIQRAADARRDLPLLAACAADANRLCMNVTDAHRLFRCLKQHKASLKPLCRNTVTSRQMESAEDIALDSRLSGACAEERFQLCEDAGWGEGAAEACLLSHAPFAATALDLLLLSNSSSKLTRSATAKAIKLGTAISSDESKSSRSVALSDHCEAALFDRKVEESEDIRFDYLTATTCLLDKQLFCRDVKPGRGDVWTCLEQHAGSNGCRTLMRQHALLRAADARLDHRFVLFCGKDVRSLCPASTYIALGASAEMLPAGSGNVALECIRQSLHLVRNPDCRSHVYNRIVSGYTDSRYDGMLLANCSSALEGACLDAAEALPCLHRQMAKGAVDEACSSLVTSRLHQAAQDIEFMPKLATACAAEVTKFCSGKHVKPKEVVTCLADHRNEPQDFGAYCHTILREHLSEAVQDVRLMSGLLEDCSSDLDRMCKDVTPGDGKVLNCLRDKREFIQAPLCKRQMLRLLGYAVEDYRLDFTLMQACKADVQQFCAGVDPGNGEVHDCLRRSLEHLSPACKRAEEAVEAMEHEDVRLNPKLQRACPAAITTFCGDVQPGHANIITCLGENLHKSNFPTECKTVLLQLASRADVKYSLNSRLKQACDPDVKRLCRGASDDPKSRAGSGVLLCLAANATAVNTTCKAQLVALARQQLTRYRMGMPLTRVCDGDVLSRCAADKLTAPFLERGYIKGCLLKHAAQLHKPCWTLIAAMDDSQFEHAQKLEAQHWSPEAMKDHIAAVALEVRRDLEPHITSSVAAKIARQISAQHEALAPRLTALMHSLKTLSFLMTLAVTLAVVAVWLVRQRLLASRSAGLTHVVKDGRA